MLQLEIVRNKILAAFPGIQVDLIARSSRGDALADIPLQTVEGSDFFTADIFEMLTSGQADIAVHSLKDMSSEHFFGDHYFAVVDRDDTRDMAIFNPDILEKISKGESLQIGTCSPRREEMALTFLRKALPQLHESIRINVKPIRGNVETRLRKLDSGEYDATLLATAGVNRLLRSEKDAPLLRSLLEGKKIMLLPLVECVPAPCQGAIVAEALPGNYRAVDILRTINNTVLFDDCYAEKKMAIGYGTGCQQSFGVTSLQTGRGQYRYAAGRDASGHTFMHWHPLPSPAIEEATLFSTTDFMRDFFRYEWLGSAPAIPHTTIFIANYKLLNHPSGTACLEGKRILASGTKTWFELAKNGYWVTACADALGFESLLPALRMPVLDIPVSGIFILTHDDAAQRWQEKGFAAAGTYRLQPLLQPAVCKAISEAKAICWSSYAQYQYYGSLTGRQVTHICAGGETARLLQEAGLDPVVFPTLKAFELWRKTYIPSPGAA